MRGERGFALVIALIITALLVALLVEFVSEVYVDTSHSKNFVASQQAEILAESGVYGGIKLLQFSSTMRSGEYSSLSEPWAKPFPYETEVGKILISIEEESGKLDLNSIVSENGAASDFHKDTFLRLLTNLKLPPELYDSLADWRDTNDQPLTNGAENNYYLNLKPPYRSHDNRFDTLEELALVRGFTPEVLAKLRPYVTVYGSGPDFGNLPTAPININTAPAELLAALDEKLMRGDLAQQILEYRKTKPIKTLSDVPGLETLTQIQLKVICKGTAYRIRSEGRVGESVSIVEAVVIDDGAGKSKVLYWREY